MHLRSIHPFPARMAPELALNSLGTLPLGSVVLDPMAGSGTVLRQAAELGLDAIGFDVDPLAVLMSTVWTSTVDVQEVCRLCDEVLAEAKCVDLRSAKLPWMKGDEETRKFIEYWFAPEQRRALYRLAVVLNNKGDNCHCKSSLDVLRLALSRIIVTKEQAASLARDTSHSRPHKVAETSTFPVFEAYKRSVEQLLTRLLSAPLSRQAQVRRGDARQLPLAAESIDSVMTSPPYLNAIDYLRGHRMSLVWLGHRMNELRTIRSTSIGAERSLDAALADRQRAAVEAVACAMADMETLSPKHAAMVSRYANDLLQMTKEVARVLKTGGRATFVVGNSCLKGTFISNSDGVAAALRAAGMKPSLIFERELPIRSRYLPVTVDGSLGKRMRTETVLTYEK